MQIEQFPRKLFKGLVLIYRYSIGYLLPPNSCRFSPSCSQYALEAIDKHGAWRGVIFSTMRILRCNPWGKGGYDPVK